MSDYELSGARGGDTPDSVSRMSALDLYEDLLIEEDKYVESRVYTMQEILEEKRLLEQQNASLLSQVVESKLKMKKIEAEKLALQQHFDSLLATARVELNRKNMLLQQHLDGRANSSHQSASKVVRSKSTGIHFPKKKNLAELYKGKRVPEDELESISTSTIISEEHESASRKSVSTKTKDSTLAIPSMSRKNSVPRDAASRKVVKDSPVSITTRRNSEPHDQISERQQAHFSGLNEQVMTKASHTEKSHISKNSSIPPMDRDRNKIDNHSTTTNVTRSNHTSANSKTVPFSATVSLLNAKSSNKEGRNYPSSMSKGVRTDPSKSQSHLPSPPPKSSSLSRLSETATSYISEGLTQKAHSSRKDTAFKLKETGKHSKSTVTKASLKKQTDHCESHPRLPNTLLKSSLSSSHVNDTRLASGNLTQKRHSPSKDPSLMKVQETDKQVKSTGLKSNSKKQSESVSHIPNTPPQSSSFSHSHANVTSYIPGSLMQKVPTGNRGKCSSLLDLKVKKSDQMSKSTMIQSNLIKQSVNRRHSSSKHKKRNKSCRKIISEHDKQVDNQIILETNPLCDMALQNTNRQSLVSLESKQYPSDMSGLHIDTSKEEKVPSTIGDAPISHAVKINQSDNEMNSSTSSMKSIKLSIDSTESDSSCEETNKKHLVEPQEQHRSNKSDVAATVEKVKPVCYPFDDTSKGLLNAGGANSNLVVEGYTPCSTNAKQSPHAITSEGVSKSDGDLLRMQSPHRPESMLTERSTLQSSPMSASVKDGLKLVIKTAGSVEKPFSYCGGKIPTNLQPHVCLVDIKSKESTLEKGSLLKTESKQNAETAKTAQPVAVCRKRKFLLQHEKDMNSKKQRESENHSTNEIETTVAAARQNHAPLRQDNDLVTCVKPAVHSVTISDVEDKNNVPRSESLHRDATVNICREAKKNSPSHNISYTQHQESETLSKNCTVNSTVASHCSAKAHMTPDRSTTISTMPNQNLGGFTSISASTPSSKTPTASCSLNAWLASSQVERQNNNPGKQSPIVVPPVFTQNADGNPIHGETISEGEKSATKQTGCNNNSKSKHYRNAALQWLIRLAVEEFKATKGLTQHPRPLSVSNGCEETKLDGSEELLKAKTKASRSLWLSSLTKCQERRKQNAQWSS